MPVPLSRGNMVLLHRPCTAQCLLLSISTETQQYEPWHATNIAHASSAKNQKCVRILFSTFQGFCGQNMPYILSHDEIQYRTPVSFQRKRETGAPKHQSAMQSYIGSFPKWCIIYDWSKILHASKIKQNQLLLFWGLSIAQTGEVESIRTFQCLSGPNCANTELENIWERWMSDFVVSA